MVDLQDTKPDYYWKHICQLPFFFLAEDLGLVRSLCSVTVCD
jgi:hypothetical protein